MPEMWEGWYCVGVMVLMFVMLLKNVAGPDILMLGALALMLAAGTVDMKSGLNGFSNKGAPSRSARVSQPTSPFHFPRAVHVTSRGGRLCIFSIRDALPSPLPRRTS